ncbi:MAG: hypothetical protein MUC29_06700 [Pyrinomonadaceae bacterium]|jgi:hypothetical protein|nr:hypothetical protein [Pyrinomonadaceae bacterium]
MKICPNCNSTYTDNNLSFCLQDGTPLVSYQNQEPETVIRQVPPVNQMRINIEQEQQSQTQQPPFLNQPTYSTENEPKKSNFLLIALGLVFGFFVLLGIGGIAGYMFYQTSGTPEIAKNTNTNVNANANSNINTNTNVNANANSNVNASTPTPKPTIKPAEIATVKKDIENQIFGWKSASENRNLDVNMNNYADSVDYYKGGKVASSKIRADKQKAYNDYDSISINISNIKITPDASGEKATATFDKDWEFSGAEKFNRGGVQQQLVFTKINGKWKITSEKELKIYFVDKGKNEEDGDF